MKRGIAFRLSALVLTASAVILGILLWYNYRVSRDLIVKQAEEKGRFLAEVTGLKIAKVFSSVQKAVDTLSDTLQEGDLTEARIKALQVRFLERNPDIYGTAVAFTPHGFDKDREYFAPYHYRSGQGLDYKVLGGPDYQYFYMDWYQLPMELHKPAWTEPYFDEGGGGALMTTYAAPFYRVKDGKKTPAGVVTADVSLGWLQKLISGIKIGDSGYVFLLSRYGAYIAHPDRKLIMNETIFSRADELGRPDLRRIGQRMRAGASDLAELKNFPGVGDAFLYYMPMPVEHWSLGVVFPKAELLAAVNQLSRTMGAVAGAGFLALAVLIIWLSRSITRPLRQLTAAADEIASGNLDLDLPEIRVRDEVGTLADSFARMESSLKTYIADLTATTAAKERIESELGIAHEIQMGILPKIFPPFPERKEFDLFASIQPAREVGGDLYDFFFIDERRFCFLVGDVSGKGVPAALFMAVTKTLLKVVAERGMEPGEVIAKVNDDLTEENDSCMFVTLFLAVLDVRTGEVRYANAGHNPPLRISRAGAAEWVSSLHEPMAGAMPGMTYTTGRMKLSPGDTLFIYTDGVTEAMNRKNELFSDERLHGVMARMRGKAPAEMIAEVQGAVSGFTDGAEQSDDITMLAVRYLGAAEGGHDGHDD